MPAGQVGELRSYFEACQATADVDCDQRGDVGDSETVASDKLLSVQLAIHPFESLMDDRPLRFAVVRELLETSLKDRARILNRASDCGEQLQFHPPVPHLDLRLLAQAAPEQVWLGMKPLQVAADRDRLGETRPVVELQHRHSAGWVLCQEFRSAALTSENIDILQRKLDSFFRREDTKPARILSHCMIVKLHCISHFEPSKTPRDDFIALGGESIYLRPSTLSVSRLVLPGDRNRPRCAPAFKTFEGDDGGQFFRAISLGTGAATVGS